jgi:hypothetical protein
MTTMTQDDNSKKPTRIKLRGGPISANFVHSLDKAILNAVGPIETEDHHPLPKRLPSGHHEPLTIDVTPTWKGILPLLLAAIENGTAKGRASAMTELNRMADLADKYTSMVKNPISAHELSDMLEQGSAMDMEAYRGFDDDVKHCLDEHYNFSVMARALAKRIKEI